MTYAGPDQITPNRDRKKVIKDYGLLKVPEEALNNDLKRQLQLAKIEIGKNESYIQELEELLSSYKLVISDNSSDADIKNQCNDIIKKSSLYVQLSKQYAHINELYANLLNSKKHE